MSWVNMEVIQKVTPWLQDTSESSDSLSDPPPPPAPIVMSLAPQRLRWPAPGKMAWVQHYGPRKNFNTLFRGEVAYYVFTDRYVRHDHPGADDITYNTTVFKDEPTGLALYGLYGCTAIVVLSKNGAWISHLFEKPCFCPEDGETYMEFKERFKEEVLPQVHKLLRNLLRSILHDDPNPVFFIMSPRRTQRYGSGFVQNLDTNEYRWEYPREVNQICNTIRGTFGNQAQIHGWGYQPRRCKCVSERKLQECRQDRICRDDRGNRCGDSSEGKVLVQWQPAGPGSPTAKAHVWFEGNLEWTMEGRSRQAAMKDRSRPVQVRVRHYEPEEFVAMFSFKLEPWMPAEGKREGWMAALRPYLQGLSLEDMCRKATEVLDLPEDTLAAYYTEHTSQLPHPTQGEVNNDHELNTPQTDVDSDDQQSDEVSSSGTSQGDFSIHRDLNTPETDVNQQSDEAFSPGTSQLQHISDPVEDDEPNSELDSDDFLLKDLEEQILAISSRFQKLAHRRQKGNLRWWMRGDRRNFRALGRARTCQVRQEIHHNERWTAARRSCMPETFEEDEFS